MTLDDARRDPAPDPAAHAMIVSLGSVNADFEVRVDRPAGQPGTTLARDLLRTSGGKAGNVAVLARLLGVDSQLLACVGDDDLAEQALAGPRRAGVDVAAVRRTPGPTGVAWIAVTPDGQKTISLALNANDGWAEDTRELERQVTAAPAGSVLVVDLEVPPHAVVAAARAARGAGRTVILDPAPPGRLPEDLLALVDHVTPDHQEAEALTGIDARSPEGARRAGEDLCGRGLGVAHVKLASGGCVTVGASGTIVTAAPDDLDVVDTTGAGDGFAGALAWGLLSGHDTGEAAAMAVAASACAVGAFGSQESYPSLEELRAMRARVVRQR